MPVHNADVAAIFNEIADLLELEEANPFRVRAYRSTAHVVGDLSRDIVTMVNQGEDLTELPGVGDDLAGTIREIVTTGHSTLLADLCTQTPPVLKRLLTIPGLGPKRVRALYRDLQIRTVEQLARAARAGRIQELPGFGEKTEQDILQAIATRAAAAGHVRLALAAQYAEPLVDYLKVEGLPDEFCYGYRVDGPNGRGQHFDFGSILLDLSSRARSCGRPWAAPDSLPRRSLLIQSMPEVAVSARFDRAECGHHGYSAGDRHVADTDETMVQVRGLEKSLEGKRTQEVRSAPRRDSVDPRPWPIERRTAKGMVTFATTPHITAPTPVSPDRRLARAHVLALALPTRAQDAQAGLPPTPNVSERASVPVAGVGNLGSIVQQVEASQSSGLSAFPGPGPPRTLLDVARESIFGDADSKKAIWRPLSLATSFTDGWLEPVHHAARRERGGARSG